MSSSCFVSDNVAENGDGPCRPLLGRMLLPAALFVITVFGAPSPSKDIVVSDNLALSEAGRSSLAELTNAVFTEER
jgi:hypothetical protein